MICECVYCSHGCSRLYPATQTRTYARVPISLCDPCAVRFDEIAAEVAKIKAEKLNQLKNVGADDCVITSSYCSTDASERKR